MACRLNSMRKDSEQPGTVTGINGKIEVEWDSGRTSYFRHGERGNIEAAAHEAVKTREQNHVHSRRAIGRSRVDA
jgi:hypothetical protein